jgi:hypothetical protein
MIHLVHQIQQCIRSGRNRLSSHAEAEREAEEILIREIEEAMLSTACAVIEDYPDDPRGHMRWPWVLALKECPFMCW